MNKVELSKEKIIRATIQIVAEKGLANARTAEIARKAGVSEGLIFKYFPTKGHLFGEIIRENFERLKSGITLELGTPDLSATAKIKAVVNFHINFFADKQNIIHLLLGQSDRKSLVDIESVFEQGFRPYVKMVATILQEGMAKGEFRAMNEEIAAMAIIGSMQVNVINKILSRSSLDFEQAKSELAEFIIAGIKG